MKKWKQIPVWAITLLLTFLIIFPSFASDNTNPESYSELAAEISPCVVTILVYEYNGKFKGQGSGFFYNKNGDIVTNSHVITKNTRAEIKTKSGNIYPVGSIIERNEKKDFLKAQTHLPKDSPFLKIARKYPAVGDKIMVAGSPLGFEQTITEGIVSAWRTHPEIGKVIQISAPISHGSSGGPVLNMAGEVVGIATLTFHNGQNLNFAVPVQAIFNNQKPKAKKLEFHKDKKGGIVIE